MPTKRKAAEAPKVPPAIAYAFRYGKSAYRRHPGFDEATEEALEVYLLCGIMINYPDKARAIWQQYREALLKKPGISEWWAYSEYETKHVKSKK